MYDVYEYRFRLEGDCEESIAGVAADFAHFRRDRVEHPIRVELLLREPPYEIVPPVNGSVYTPRNISYRGETETYLDYKGRGLGVHDRRAGDFRIYSLDTDLLYEAAYLFLLSQIGERLDAKGLHRLHAMAVAVRGRAVLVLLPMGGGKSTLASELLKDPEVKLLSDDSPFIDRKARVYSFPLHIGLLPGSEKEVPAESLRSVNRIEAGLKYLVNYESYAHRVEAEAEPGFVFLGRRNLTQQCRIEEAGRIEALRSVIANCVVGLGLFQGMEFIFQHPAHKLAGKAGIGLSRLTASLELLRRSTVRRLSLGRCHETNAKTLLDFVRGRIS